MTTTPADPVPGFRHLPAPPPLPADWPPYSPAAASLRNAHYASYRPHLVRSPIDPSDVSYGGFDFELEAVLLRRSGWVYRPRLTRSFRNQEVMEAAAALVAFTATELCEYTTAASDTVRRIIREERARGSITQVGAVPSKGRGRPPAIWQITPEARARILALPDQASRSQVRREALS